MKGKTILITAGCVLGFGGIIANTTVGIIEAKKLENEIATLRDDAKQADEDYKKATVDQLTALIENTRSNLKAAYEAADVSLKAGLDGAIAAIEEAEAQIAADVDAKDAAYAKKAADDLKALAEATEDALDLLDSDVEALQAFQTAAAAQISTISNNLTALSDDLDDVKDELEEAEAYIDSVADYAVQLGQNLQTVSNNLNALTSNLANNYYKAADVDTLVSTLDTKIADVFSYFKVGDNYVSMETLDAALTLKFGAIDDDINTIDGRLDAADTKFGELDQSIADIEAELLAHDGKFTIIDGKFDDVTTKFQAIDLALADIDDAFVDFNDRVTILEGKLTTLTGGWEEFNGTDAVTAKAQYVGQLWSIIFTAEQEIDDVYDSICDEYTVQSRTVPADVTTLYNNLKTAAHTAAQTNADIYAYITKIILAPTKEAAFAVLGDITDVFQCNKDQLVLELLKIKASNVAYNAVAATASNQYKFTYAEFNYFDEKIMDVEYDTTITDVEARAEHFEELKDELDLYKAQASQYVELTTRLSDAYNAITNLEQETTASRSTTQAMLATYKADLTTLSVFADYKVIIEQVNSEGEPAYDEEGLQAVVKLLVADANIIVYAADMYDQLLKYEEAIEATGIPAATYETIVGSADFATAMAAIAAEIADTAYIAAYETTRNANDPDAEGEPTDAEVAAYRKGLIDQYIADAKVDMDYEVLCIKLIYNVATAKNTADTTIDGLTNVVASAEDVIFKNAYGSTVATMPDLAEIYTLTGKGTDDYVGNDASVFAEMEDAYVGYINDIVTIAKNQEALYVDLAASLTSLDTIETSAVAADAIAAKANFVTVLNKTFENYTFIDNGQVKGLSSTTTSDLADQSAIDITAAKANNIVAIEGYSTFVAAVKAADDFNSNIQSGIDVVTALFAIEYNNAADDGGAVVTEYSTVLQALHDDSYISHAMTGDVYLQPFYYSSGADYDDNITSLENTTAALKDFLDQMDLRRANFNDNLADIKAEMIEAYEEKEATRLANEIAKYAGANKDGADGDLRTLYDAVLTLVAGNSTKTTTAGMFFDAALRAIVNAETSDLPEKAYTEIVGKFITLIDNPGITTLQELLDAAGAL